MIPAIVMNAAIIKIATKAVEAALPALIDAVQNKLGKKQNFSIPSYGEKLDQQLAKIQAALVQNTKQIKALEMQVQGLAALLEYEKSKTKTPIAKKTAVKQAVIKGSVTTKLARKK